MRSSELDLNKLRVHLITVLQFAWDYYGGFAMLELPTVASHCQLNMLGDDESVHLHAFSMQAFVHKGP